MGWKTVGQSTSIERVSRAIHQKRLSHAYLICGADGVGKLTFALDIAKIANCLNVDRDLAPCGSCNQCLRIEAYNHTDVHLYDVDRDSGSENHASTMVSIEQLREDFLKKVHILFVHCDTNIPIYHPFYYQPSFLSTSFYLYP